MLDNTMAEYIAVMLGQSPSFTSRQMTYSRADPPLLFAVNQKTSDEINEELADCELIQDVHCSVPGLTLNT